MPFLPQIEVTVPQWDRLKAVLPGDTAAEKVVEYEAIVRRALTEYVLDSERNDLIRQHQQALEQALAESRSNADNLAPLDAPQP